MRDRLIELLIKGNNQPCGNGSPWEDNYCKGCEYENKKDCRVLQLADYLLVNGVIVPPCKVGDVVYEALPKVGHIRSNKVVGFHLGKFPDTQGHKRKEYLICYSDYSLTHIAIEKFGKTVFLTKEEAMQALKGGEGDGTENRNCL